MAELIDLSLLTDANQLLDKLLHKHGINWFLAKDGPRLMALEKAKIDLVIETAIRARSRKSRSYKPPRQAVEHCRRQIRRQLIQRVAMAMLQTGC